MKKYFMLLLIFAICSVYIFYRGYGGNDKSSGKGDAPSNEVAALTIGGTIEDPENNVINVGEMQTAYIMYVKGDLKFDDMIEKNMTMLKNVLNYPFNPLKGYLFSVGYDDSSRVQFYYQSNQEETRTVIMQVTYGENGNEVTKVYDGEYYKLVAVDETNPGHLTAYDVDNDQYLMVVE